MSSSPRKLFGNTAFGGLLSGGAAIVAHEASKIAPSNTLVKIATGGEQLQKRWREGEGINGSMLGDAAGLFTKTQSQKDAIAADAAYAADAPNRAAIEATQDANTALRAKNLRRRASAMGTGSAAPGDALLSSVMAYGKSTLGG